MCVFGFILATSNGPGQRHGISVTRIFLPAKCGRMAQNAEKIGYQGISRLNCSGMTNIEARRSTAWCIQCTLYTGEARTNVHVHVINLRTAAFHFTMLRPTFWPNSWRHALLSRAPTRGNRIRCRMYIGTCALLRIEFSEFRLKVTWLRIVEEISPITGNVNARLVVSLLHGSSFSSGITPGKPRGLSKNDETHFSKLSDQFIYSRVSFSLRGVQTLRSRYIETILKVSHVSTMFASTTIKWLLVAIDVF